MESSLDSDQTCWTKAKEKAREINCLIATTPSRGYHKMGDWIDQEAYYTSKQQEILNEAKKEAWSDDLKRVMLTELQLEIKESHRGISATAKHCRRYDRNFPASYVFVRRCASVCLYMHIYVCICV